MTKPGGNPADAVAGLMQERQRFEAWLAALEAKRSVTPPHVFERVKADYEARLKAVTDQLMGRASEVKETLTALTARLARVQQEESSKRDARYENELRADVGELAEGEWQAMQRRYDEEMAALARERDSIAHEVARLNQILSMTDARGVEPRRPTPGAGGGPTVSGGLVFLENAPPPARAPGGSSFDELAFLKSVVDPHENARRGGGSPEQRPSGAAPVPPRSPTPSAPSPSGIEKSTATQTGTPAAGSESQPAPSEPAPVPTFLKDVPSEQTRTLKCAECGSMNFPTEWYCERCGAELAGM